MRQPFTAHTLPVKNLKRERFIHLIASANRALARFDGLLQSIPNASVLLTPLTTREATLSSKIEGTQATVQEVMEFEANPTKPKELTERHKDIQEILNYRKAMQYAIEETPHKLLTTKLIREVHGILLNSVRGTNKDRGNFRSGQVHIGSSRSPEDARFIPPSPQHIAESMSNREKYIHYDEKDVLVQLAIVHAQFEIIHPFWDGNGRVGRIILPLFLWYKKVLHSPMFYVSEYLESNRQAYYDSLQGISENNNREGWIEYFLHAVEKQSNTNIDRVKSILALYDTKKEKIRDLTHSQYAINALDCIFSYPIFTTTQFVNTSKIPEASAKRVLQQLVDGKVLIILEKGQGRKPTSYVFQKLIKITG